MLEDVLGGLSRDPPEISPRYFYDRRGSELFEEITYLDEYYPTRTEHHLLRRWMRPWVAESRPVALVELGAGSARKSRVLLDAMEEQRPGGLYVPVDVSGEFLQATARRLRREYRHLRVAPAVADMTAPFELPGALPEPAWFALLGSTIGNFTAEAAALLLSRVAARMRPRDRFLLGVDLKPGPHKSRARLEAAYNDADGITAAFNRNVLRVLNRELGTDFDEDGFRHHAFYDERHGRIEMHLVAERDQRVHFPGGHVFEIRRGASIRTELSHKYDRPTVDALFVRAGLEVERWAEDAEGLFALVMGRVA